MDKRLSEEEFNRAVAAANVGQQTRDIAYGVLVQGRSQVEFVTSTGLTKGAISQAVKRVYDSAMKLRQGGAVPPGYEVVTAVLPEAQAFQVKQWAKAAEAKRRRRSRKK